MSPKSLSFESRVQAILKERLPWYLVVLVNIGIGTFGGSAVLAIASNLGDWVEFDFINCIISGFIYAYVIYRENKPKKSEES